MRIYLAFLQSDPLVEASANVGFWGPLMRMALREAGHEVFECPGVAWSEGLQLMDVRARREWRARQWETVLRNLQEIPPPDLFLGYFFPEMIEVSAIREIQRRGIPTVHFFCDNVREFRSIPSEFLGFDLHWVPEWDALPLYRKSGLPHLNAPMPAWVPQHLRRPGTETLPKAVFIGSCDGPRARLFATLPAKGIEIQIHGRNWEPPHPEPRFPALRGSALWQARWRNLNQHGWLSSVCSRFRKPLPVTMPPSDWLRPPASAEEHVRLTREAAITLGVNRFESPRHGKRELARYSRQRDIEAPMLGACYLTEWAPGLDQLFDLENEIAIYRNEDELAETLRMLLGNQTRRTVLRAAGQRRALADHTIASTVEKIRLNLGLRTRTNTSL
jgi:hypothetical protein